MVKSFKYLGLIITASDDYWPAVVGNLRKSRKIWERLLRILGMEGENPIVSGMFLKSVVQAVLLFVANVWFMTPAWAGPWGGGFNTG